MINEYKTVFDIEREQGYEEGFQRGEQRGEQRRKQQVRNMVKTYLTQRFPRLTQTALNRILSITDADALESVFNLALSSDSLASFKKSVRALAPTI